MDIKTFEEIYLRFIEDILGEMYGQFSGEVSLKNRLNSWNE